MSDSKRFRPIKNLAKNQEKLAVNQLAIAIANHNQAVAKLEQLNQYRVDYLQQMQSKIQQTISGGVLQQYQQFLSKLDVAIEQQKLAILQAEKTLKQCKNDWQVSRGKTKAISQAMDKMIAKEQKRRDKKEAAQVDEISTQAFLRRQHIGQ